MSTDSHTMVYRVHPTPPPTHNSLTPAQKAQLRRSNTKLTSMLGAAPQVVEDNSVTARPQSPQPYLSISSGRTSSSHRRTRSADPELSPLSASPRPVSRDSSHRARRSTDAQFRSAGADAHAAQRRASEHRVEDVAYEPAFAIPSETKVKRDKLSRVCKILGRDVPSNLVFPSNEPPSYEEIERADKKAAARRSRTPVFPEDYLREQQYVAAPPSQPGPTHMFPEDYLPHVRAERDRQAVDKAVRKAAEKKDKAGRRSYMPMFPEECVGDRFEADCPAKAQRGPTFMFPEDYIPHIQAQREAQAQAAAAGKYRSPLETITELKHSSPAARASSSSDSSSDDDSRGSFSSATTSASYRVHPGDHGRSPYGQQQQQQQLAAKSGRRESSMSMPFRRRAVGLGCRSGDKVEFEIVHGVQRLNI